MTWKQHYCGFIRWIFIADVILGQTAANSYTCGMDIIGDVCNLGRYEYPGLPQTVLGCSCMLGLGAGADDIHNHVACLGHPGTTCGNPGTHCGNNPGNQSTKMLKQQKSVPGRRCREVLIVGVRRSLRYVCLSRQYQLRTCGIPSAAKHVSVCVYVHKQIAHLSVIIYNKFRNCWYTKLTKFECGYVSNYGISWYNNILVVPGTCI